MWLSTTSWLRSLSVRCFETAAFPSEVGIRRTTVRGMKLGMFAFPFTRRCEESDSPVGHEACDLLGIWCVSLALFYAAKPRTERNGHDPPGRKGNAEGCRGVIRGMAEEVIFLPSCASETGNILNLPPIKEHAAIACQSTHTSSSGSCGVSCRVLARSFWRTAWFGIRSVSRSAFPKTPRKTSTFTGIIGIRNRAVAGGQRFIEPIISNML
ncbi:hypothetical protein B0H12DRAFT_350149 [Mycena haematopus]|nr:hypothetical protein B0H12DRAFT_350149 [Mycena haematopus]